MIEGERMALIDGNVYRYADPCAFICPEWCCVPDAGEWHWIKLGVTHHLKESHPLVRAAANLREQQIKNSPRR